MSLVPALGEKVSRNKRKEWSERNELRYIARNMLVINLYIPQLSLTRGTKEEMRHSLLAETRK